MTEWLLPLLKISIVLLILAIGMGSTASDLTYLWRRPALLLRSLLAMYVLVPLVALVLVHLVDMIPAVKAALLVLAVSTGAPLLPKKLGSLNSDQYVFSLVVTSSLLAVVLVPLWVMLLSHYFGTTTQVSPFVIAKVIAKSFLIPLVAGMLLRVVFPASARLSAPILRIAGLTLVISGILLLLINWQILQHVGWRGITALVVLLVFAIAIGHVMGGPSYDDRTALAIACATRHIGISMVVASTFPGPKTIVLIAAYVVTAALVTIPYMIWRKKHAKAEAPAAAD